METLGWLGTALVPGLTDSHKGLPADAVCWAENAPGAVPGAIGGCRYTAAVQESGLTGPIAYATRLVAGHGAAFQARLRAVFGTALSVGATGAVLPDARSRVTLHPARRDAHGVPLPVIDSVLTENSIALLHHMAAQGRALLRAAGGGGILEQVSSWDRFTATHVFGTARMGHDSAQSVTDPHGRSHDHPNLWIADASLFPSSGGGEGPSLTIQALALRSAARLVADG
jgi:choline dehydrogenase-like flavoprotein